MSGKKKKGEGMEGGEEEKRISKRLNRGIQPLQYESKILENGLRCFFYHDKTMKPGNAKITMVVKAGHLCELESEAGSAHLLEHLVLRAALEAYPTLATNLSDHNLHQTFNDHTVFRLSASNKEDMAQVIQMFGYMSNQVTISSSQLEAERTIVRMEYYDRLKKGSVQLTDHSYELLNPKRPCSVGRFQKNLDCISLQEINHFYKKWYIASHMALIVVGNYSSFQDLLSVVEESFKGRKDDPISLASTAPQKPLLHILTNEDSLPKLILLYPYQQRRLNKPEDLLDSWVRDIIHKAVGERLESLLDHVEPQCNISVLDYGVNYLLSFTINADKPFSRDDLHTLLLQIRSVNELGLTTKELEKGCITLSEKIEFEIEKYSRDVHHRSQVVTNQFLNHFLYGDTIMDRYSELPLANQNLRSSIIGKCRNFFDFGGMTCILTIGRHEESSWSGIRIDDTLAIVNSLPVEQFVSQISIADFEDHQCKNDYVVSETDYNHIDVREWRMPNGMVVAFHPSHDIEVGQVLYLAFEKFDSRKIEEDECTNVMLSLSSELDSDKERLMYEKALMKACGDSYLNQAYEGNYATTIIEEGDAIKLRKALRYFRKSFSNPSEFKIIIVGDLQTDFVKNLVMKYLGSIPSSNFPSHPSHVVERKLPIEFPFGQHRHKYNMDIETIQAFVSLPLKLNRESLEEDMVLVAILRKVIQQRLLKFLRWDKHVTYKVQVMVHYDGLWFASSHNDEGILTVCFDFEESFGWELIDEVLQELETLQIEGVSKDVLLAAVDSQQTNYSIAREIALSYLSPLYHGNLQETHLEKRRREKEVLRFDEQDGKDLIRRFLPGKISDRYSAVLFHSTFLDDGEDIDESESGSKSESDDTTDDGGGYGDGGGDDAGGGGESLIYEEGGDESSDEDESGDESSDEDESGDESSDEDED